MEREGTDPDRYDLLVLWRRLHADAARRKQRNRQGYVAGRKRSDQRPSLHQRWFRLRVRSKSARGGGVEVERRGRSVGAEVLSLEDYARTRKHDEVVTEEPLEL